MSAQRKRLMVGIVGCGAIGSRIAKSLRTELKQTCELTGLYDINDWKVQRLAKQFKNKKLVTSTLQQLVKGCQLMVEAVNSTDTKKIIHQAIRAKRHVLAMSVGQLIDSGRLVQLAERNKCSILIPSGAIAGLDALKAASLRRITSATLTTRKPLKGFENNPYLKKRGLNLSKIKKETVIFEGTVSQAVKHFPQNINVAAAIALAIHSKTKLKIRILTSPKWTSNSHTIDVKGDFGHIQTQTTNTTCPDNPKTSYLAVLSAIQTLKQFSVQTKIGT